MEEHSHGKEDSEEDEESKHECEPGIGAQLCQIHSEVGRSGCNLDGASVSMMVNWEWTWLLEGMAVSIVESSTPLMWHAGSPLFGQGNRKKQGLGVPVPTNQPAIGGPVWPSLCDQPSILAFTMATVDHWLSQMGGDESTIRG